MNDTLLSAIISGAIGLGGALLGAFVGGKFNIKASMNATQRNIDAQNEVIRNEKELKEKNKEEEIQDNIKMIYLDFVAAIWESWLTNKSIRLETKIPMIPMNTEYAKSVGLISDKFNIEELILINKIYGMIEKIRKDIFKYKYDDRSRSSIEKSTEVFLSIIYGEKYIVLSRYDTKMFTKDFALENLCPEYKLLLNKLKENSGLV